MLNWGAAAALLGSDKTPHLTAPYGTASYQTQKY